MPELVEYLSSEEFKNGWGLIVAQQGSKVAGLLKYDLMAFAGMAEQNLRNYATGPLIDEEEIPVAYFPAGQLSGLKDLGMDDIVAQISFMESLEKRQGIGKAMIEGLLNYASPKAVLAEAVNENAAFFYERAGFKRTGLYVEERSNPIMVLSAAVQ